MFGLGGNGVSLADIAAVTDNNRNGNGDGFGYGMGGWWVLIILLALFGGFGGNGWSNNGRGNNCGGETTVVTVPMGGYGFGGGAMGFAEAAVQRGFDNQAVVTKLDGITQGICNLGYDQLNQMNGINNTVMQTGWGVTQAINNSAVANTQNTNALSTQLAACCCENRAGLADIKYTLATDACAINTNVHQTGDAIINSQNAGFQMLNNTINDRFTRLEMAQKDQRIADLELRLNQCDRDSALQGMSSYIINSLNPPARPAYIVQNPNCCSAVPVQIQSNGCGCNSGCGNTAVFS